MASIINWYYGDMKNVERIYKENETIYNHISKLCTKMTPIIDNIISKFGKCTQCKRGFKPNQT